MKKKERNQQTKKLRKEEQATKILLLLLHLADTSIQNEKEGNKSGRKEGCSGWMEKGRK